ncbi:hypothetical protein AVEN_36535-1 [Araneus ventricosus]|uniref:Uncharacterized protein n=1 Tax=Araneus ventricosus TaxID=182803 RepID=A0A4Y2LUG9_ARAVE|nr:hypothetical protein AVEN_102891-1 [Araneus ventricosus]GBN18492.1 hypothetical protein AVEN_36535-1 [Araneus ventricosus]
MIKTLNRNLKLMLTQFLLRKVKEHLLRIENEQECGVNLDRMLSYAEPGEHICELSVTMKENEETTKFAVTEVYHQEGKTIKPSIEFTEKKFANVSQAKDSNSKVHEVSFKEEVSVERTPLPNPKGVQGWRGVLGKICPDPVRVESIGISVGDLLADKFYYFFRRRNC